MAIAKMHKISLVTLPSVKEDVLYTLQKLSNVEISDLQVKTKTTNETMLANRLETASQENYQRGQAALKVLKQYQQKVPLRQKLQASRPEMTMNQLYERVDQEAVLALIDQVEHLVNRRQEIVDQRHQVENDQSSVVKWQNLTVLPQDLADLKYFDVRLGTIPNDDNREYFNALVAAKDLAVEEVYASDKEIGIAAIAVRGNEANVDQLLTENHFQALDYHYQAEPSQVFQDLEAQRKQLINDEDQVVADLQAMQARIQDIQVGVEAFYNQAQREQASLLSYDNDQLVMFSGWVEESELEDLRQALASHFNNQQLALVSEEITTEEIEADEVPIKLHNSALVEPFEMVTEMYSLPNYREVDPTNWVAIFYMVFFAMMMGDLGYGILLWAGTLIALKTMDLRKGARRFVKFGYILSYPTMLVGLIYGSFFGVAMPVGLLNPTEDAMVLMGISIGIGMLHLMVALCLNIYLNGRKGDWGSAFNDGIGWLMMIIAIIMAVAGFAFKTGILIELAKWTAIIAAIGIILVPIIQADKKAIGGVLGLYNLYGASSYIGDFVSYTRLMALGISGGSIAMSFNIIFGILPPVARFTVGILLIVALQLFNMFLSLLSAYVHSLRLIFVEFFGKFYEGGGKPFKPIRTLQQYIKLKDVEEQI
ncbi:V-type sodium ATPase, subunit I [Aerococcus urinaehominis]|uniref:V-type sodium ATPase, subunit I n=1 Tax=Aerococcus urinaehominis TaxID=128944 RepID=A0A0X8FKZ8_9LACT|nr:V-type ATP synthase subunit I [Aerococcus urinaehominis]AMB99242.1 V-type sodium ATPase, subunit I [Aerococcus urinaehominis]SDM31344.1 V/A-type H+-transporting ATPase subunit I [Aerococcus urinaehominis]